MNVIAKVSCYFERSVVTLKLHKECLNTVTYNTPVLLWIKIWTVWYIERYCMSTYTGVTNCQKTVRDFGPPCIYVFLSKSCPRCWISCCLLTNTEVTFAVMNFWCHKLIAKINKQKNSGMENFICNQYWKQFTILNTKDIKICGWIKKLEAIKMQFVCILFHFCRKFDFFISKGSVATCLRWGG